ncbi:hypothetical protein [Sphingobacterium sp. HSC-15S19]|uniref:hypothetical protein n=1 Tax=Sphingobacterium sp. HSC-15S19 TaxID=2910971 RepID=UPI003D2440F2
MIISEIHKLHFFIKDESTIDWNDLTCQAWLEIPQSNNKTKLRQVEHIRLFMFKDMDKHETARFEIDFGSGNVVHSGHDNIKEFYKQQTSQNWCFNYKISKKEEYMVFRQSLFDIYQQYQMTNFDKIVVGAEIH